MIYQRMSAVAIKPIGIEFRITINCFTLVSQNAAGLAEMNRFLTKHNFKTPLPAQAPEFHNVSIIIRSRMLLMFLEILNF
jgi:DNA polymerase-3 subunit alpha/error-prone DNA polymerase